MEHLDRHIEALIFASDNPITEEEIRQALEAAFETTVEGKLVSTALQAIRTRFQSAEYPFEMTEIGGGYSFLTKGAYFNTIAAHLKLTTQKRLSKAALETLSIIAYKQPVTKGDVENIRGVNCDYTIQKLLEKELVSIVGRSEGPGRPLLYSTSEKFMDYFGIKSLEDLPKPKDFKEPDNTIGQQAPMEEAIVSENKKDDE